MAADAVGQLRHNCPAVRRLPALPTVEHRPGAQDNVLNDVILIALEARAFGDSIGLEDFRIVDGEFVVFRTAASGRLSTALFPRAGLGVLLHARGLDVRLALQSLQPCHLLTQRFVCLFEPGVVLQNLHQQRLQLIETQPVEISR